MTEAGEVTLVQGLRTSPGISTYLGVRGPSGEPVVLRRLDLALRQSWSFDWLVRDLEVVAAARSCQLVPTTVARSGSDDMWLVRPYVVGRDIRGWAAQRPPASFELFLSLMRQTFAGLAELHRLGIVHSGVSPANVFVSGDDAQLLLTDAVVTRAQLTVGPGAPGSSDLPRPALAGPFPGASHPVGFSADISAAGWLLLQCLVERGQGAVSLAEQIARPGLTGSQLGRLIDDVTMPPELRPVFSYLLAPSCDGHYVSADDVVAELDALTTGGLGPELPSPRSGGAAARSVLGHVTPPLVGRGAEMQVLSDAVEAAARGEGAVACVSGESGIGKTRLLEAVTGHAREGGISVLRGRAFSYTAQRPFGLFDGVFSDLVEQLATQPSQAEEAREVLGDLLAPLLALIPDLARVFPGEPGVDVRGPWVVDAIAAATQLLLLWFTEAAPGLLVLDDCQWADDSSLQLLEKIAAAVTGGAGRPAHFTVLCGLRTEAAAAVRSWGNDGVAFVDLRPLEFAEAEELVRSVGGRLPDDVVHFVVSHSGGNPMDALSAFRALADPALRVDGGPSGVTGEFPGGVPAPPWEPDQLRAWRPRGDPGPRAFLSARLEGVSAETERALRQAGVLGRRFFLDVLGRALGKDPDRCAADLREAVDRGIVRQLPEARPGHFEFTHDRLRDAVLDMLTEPSRRELHARAASALLRDDAEQDAYEIAYHFDRSENAAAALPYALNAAEAALRQSALDVALTNYMIAKAGLEAADADGPPRFRVSEGLGIVHMLRGSYEPAEVELKEAYAAASSLGGDEAARVALLIEELAFKLGRFEDAEVWRNRSIQGLRLRVPRSFRAAAWSLPLQLLLVVLTLSTRHLLPRWSRSTTERTELSARVCNRMVYDWWFSRSRVWVFWAALRALRLARSEPAQAYATAAIVLAGHWPTRSGYALRLAIRGLRWRQAAKDDWGIAQSQHFYGFVLHTAGRYDDAVEAFRSSITAFETVGDRWEEFAARWQRALCVYRRGGLHAAGALARETYHASKRIGDRTAAGTALALWARCLPHEVSSELIAREIQWTGPEDHHTNGLLTAAQGWRLLHEERYEAAAAVLDEAARSLRRAGVRNVFVAPAVTWRLHALRLWFDATPAWLASERRRRLRLVRRQLRRALHSALVFHAERPEVLRTWAMLCFAQGRDRRGNLLLRAALRSAKRLMTDGELAACHFVMSMASRSPKVGAGEHVESCRRLGVRVDRGFVEAETPQRTPLVSTSDARQHELLDAVRCIVSASDPDGVLIELRSAVLALTPARSVRFLDATGRGDGDNEATSPRTALDVGIVRQSVFAGSVSTVMEAEFPAGQGPEYATTLEVFVTLAGAAMEREALRNRSAERMVAVQEAERGRVARDLHDEFGSIFTAIIGAMGSLMHSEGGGVRRIAEDTYGIAQQGLLAARAVAWGLRPSGLDDLGLAGCVEQFVEDFQHRSRIPIEVTTDGDGWSAVPVAVETAVFRIVQEALTNVDRHSGATAASVLLLSSADRVRAIIEDNGVGFDQSQDRTSLGLVGMRERTRLVGGRLMIESEPGRGTSVLVEVPVRR
jgi:two-component system sensor kinase